jgi:CRISPR-associated protein Cas1
MALHALLYCERLYYLEEVEEIRVADAAVYAGRRLHDDVVPMDDESPEKRAVEVASERWGLFGKIDAVRRRDGAWVAYEHKRGRCRRGDDNTPLAWPSDRIQAVAYAILLEEVLGESVPQARIRYHAENVTALVNVDDTARQDLAAATARARQLRHSSVRPPIADNEHLCRRCSLAPICLPEEERLEPVAMADRKAPTLFPSNRERQTVHVISPKAHVGRSRDTLVVTTEEGTQKVPIQEVDAVVIHGFGQLTTQAIHLCAFHGVAVQWMTGGGRFAAGTSASPGRVQQRIRQYTALTDETTRLRLARQLVHAKVETQLRYLLRATRGNAELRASCQTEVDRIRETCKGIATAASVASLLGLEGLAAKNYFATLPRLLAPHVPSELHPQGRSKHPPRDRFNCLLSFGYALVQGLVHRCVLAVGLEPAFGFYHQPRTAAPPLVLDLMELFRTLLCEIPVIGSINRGQWDGDLDFEISPDHIWLSDRGRKKALQLFEQRLEESHQHPHTGQALTYTRLVELEVRLLEKEWSGCPGLFAQMRLR